MKKIIPILIIGILIISGLGASASVFKDIKSETNFEKTKTTCITSNDELDQYQLDMEWFAPVGPFPLDPSINYMIAQGFTPTKKVLTRVELMIGRNETTTYDYTVAIKDDLYGPDLTSVSVAASEIVIANYSWTEFDFDDIIVTPGTMYYIVSSTVDATENWYVWGCMLSNVYPNGTAWATEDEGGLWEEEINADLAFATYGTDNLPPNPPNINGPVSGAAGTAYDYGFTSIDPDDDDIAEYIVDWGDDTGEEIVTGPFGSGEEVLVGHTWVEQGEYTITVKAKDINGYVSEESTAVISMPVNQKLPNTLIFSLLERFTNIFPILRYIFGI